MFGKACLGSAFGHDILFRRTQSSSWNLELEWGVGQRVSSCLGKKTARWMANECQHAWDVRHAWPAIDPVCIFLRVVLLLLFLPRKAFVCLNALKFGQGTLGHPEGWCLKVYVTPALGCSLSLLCWGTSGNGACSVWNQASLWCSRDWNKVA